MIGGDRNRTDRVKVISDYSGSDSQPFFDPPAPLIHNIPSWRDNQRRDIKIFDDVEGYLGFAGPGWHPRHSITVDFPICDRFGLSRSRTVQLGLFERIKDLPSRNQVGDPLLLHLSVLGSIRHPPIGFHLVLPFYTK